MEMLLEARKTVEEEYLPAVWQLAEDNQTALLRHGKAAIYGVLFTIFGLIVVSFDVVKPKPGTTVIRDKIFGIDQNYFLVYFNGLLLYVCWILIMEEPEIPAVVEDDSGWFAFLSSSYFSF